ncbi:outer membrane protein [Vogesella sp. LIG4]|uniref:outer membrane protein n=1 Tax=Vogesella sp. LIG4 TaxID=1192162 RepID=UPI00081FF5C9|nr:outer membrane beta-barrel protein [Vogesella sp. LIG4]SCK24652.1 Opacity protein [Vogesella sp. LIG4]
MKFANLCLSAVAMCCMSAAFAAQGNFTGPSISLGLGSSSNKIKYGGFLDGQSSSKTDVVSDLQFNYGIAAGSNWVIGLGASYDLNDRKFGTVNYIDGGPQTVDVKLKEHWSLFVTPGYLVQPDLLVYGKLAYHGAKGEYHDTDVGNGTRHHQGIGYGVGVNYALTRAIELGAEVQYVSLSRESANLSNGKPSFTEAMLRVGYRF